jgi:Alpha 1,4-glycosyltransferase conserved region
MYSPAFRSHCNGTKLEWGEGGYCGKLRAFPHPKCFPQGIGDWEKFYLEEFAKDVKDTITRNGAYFSHIWNKMLAFNQKKYELSHDSKAAYIELAKVYCPRVLATRNYF